EPVEHDNRAWEEKHLHPLQVQAKLWENARRPEGLLLSAEAVHDAAAWAEENATLVTEGEREFLAQSQRRRERESTARFRLRALLARSGVVAALIAVLGVSAEKQRRMAERAQGVAEQARSVAQRQQQRDEQHLKGVCKAAVTLNETIEKNLK